MFQVWIRNAGSTASYDAYRSAGPYVVGHTIALAVTELAGDRRFPVPQGTLRWTASAAGGSGPYTYKFYVHDGAAWSVGQDWSASRTWTWIPTAPGRYIFQAWVRNAGLETSYDAYRSAGPATVVASAPLAVSALSATSGFWVFDGATWTVAQSWNASDTCAWTPPARGTYSMQVGVRNAGSARPWDAYGSARPIVVGP